MKTRIALISNSTFSSGAEQSLFELIDHKQDRFSYVMVRSKESYHYKSMDTKLRDKVQNYYLPLMWFYKTWNPITLAKFFLNTLFYSYKLAQFIKRSQIDLIYANTTKAAVYGVIAKIFSGKKLIWHIRDNIESNLLYKTLIYLSDTLITVSSFIEGQVKDRKKNTQVITGGIDCQVWDPDLIEEKTLRESLGIREDELILAQIGQITKWKNHHHFIKVAKHLSQQFTNIHFVIIGDDLSNREEAYHTELKELCNKLANVCSIHLLGYTENIRTIISQIDILIHPAINEPFGRVILESMAMKKPVIAYNCGGVKEIIRHDITGYLIEPNDYKTMTSMASHLIADTSLREKFGVNGRNRAVSKFKMEHYVQSIEATIDSTIQ